MNWIAVSILLSICFTIIACVNKYLNKIRNINWYVILLNSFIISFGCSILFYVMNKKDKELKKNISSLDYILIILLGITVFSIQYLVLSGSDLNINYALISGFSKSLSLILILLIGYLYFKESISYSQIIGLILITIGIFLLIF